MPPFKVLLTGVRCVALGASIVLVGFDPHPLGRLAWAIPLLAIVGYRVLYPARTTASLGRQRSEFAVEIGVAFAVVACTGWWRSEYIFALLGAVIVAGFTQGMIVALFAALASSSLLTVLAVAVHRNVSPQTEASWSANLVLLAVVSGYTRWMFREAETRSADAMEGARLASTNALLTELQGLAQNLSVSLDITECAQAVADQTRNGLGPEVLALMVHQEQSQTWDVVINDGLRIPAQMDLSELPAPARLALDGGRQSIRTNLGPGLDVSQDHGLSLTSRSGLYIPLVNGHQPIGLIALEHSKADRWGEADRELADVLGSKAVLALDNALRFSTLCVFGPGDERNRIAQDLHDHLGQSLAALGLEMDRINRNSPDHPAHEELLALRLKMRDVVTQLRGTLHDLRTDVSEAHDLVSVLYEVLRRQPDQGVPKIVFQHNAPVRLPLLKERQVLLIAKEAVANARRHAGAKHIWVLWSCQSDRAILEISDDGDGFHPPDDFGAGIATAGLSGLAGMYRRAVAIDATLTIKPVAAGGTVVRCTLAP
ncbi:MAG: sensor histidine kinase [Acidimicrobiales bacterium]